MIFLIAIVFLVMVIGYFWGIYSVRNHVLAGDYYTIQSGLEKKEWKKLGYLKTKWGWGC